MIKEESQEEELKEAYRRMTKRDKKMSEKMLNAGKEALIT